jgi:hypothetical protein
VTSQPVASSVRRTSQSVASHRTTDFPVRRLPSYDGLPVRRSSVRRTSQSVACHRTTDFQSVASHRTTDFPVRRLPSYDGLPVRRLPSYDGLPSPSPAIVRRTSSPSLPIVRRTSQSVASHRTTDFPVRRFLRTTAVKITRPEALGHATALISSGPKARPFA